MKTGNTLSNAVRFLSADGVEAASSGHPGMPMGMAESATALFTRVLKFDASDPDWADRDRFVLSAGHGSMLLYSLLYLTGYPKMTLDQLKNFRQLGSLTAGHPEYGHAPGIEMTTGPLGQGIATAVGMALAERMSNARYGDELVDHYTYVIAGDGCLMEGISHEAISLAGHLGLGRLIVLWDDNDICIDGPLSKTVDDDQLARFRASNWDVCSVDGHDMDAVEQALLTARGSDKPTLIACKTTIGRGAPHKQGTAATHGAPLGTEELQAAREAMGWPYGPFEVPDDVLGEWRLAGSRGKTARQAWQDRLAASAKKSDFERGVNGDLVDGWQEALNAHKKQCSTERPGWATRKASGEALTVLTECIPELIGGSADLTGSVNTMTPSTLPVTPDDYSGRYLHYGVREHGMAAAMNGIALHGGFVPYGGTFLVFADYMKGAIRLSALMGTRVVYVLTHDSIGLGEDGPTHQAVETLAMLRALPNFNVYRPCDAVEAAECWADALQHKGTPSGMVLSRQGLPLLRVDHTDDNLSGRGGYVLKDASGDRQATLLATGSEVQIVIQAREKLESQGINTAVVSMPSWQRFDQQDASYREQVLGKNTVRVAVEAAVQMGWERYIGIDGGFVGMTGFGASAPAKDLYEHFGITADAVIEQVTSRL